LEGRILEFPQFSVVIGGAASGKSRFSEDLVRRSGLAKVYIATAQAFDAEMHRKIEDHKAARIGKGWRTVEAPQQLNIPIAQLELGEIALLDCATLWLSNLMLSDMDWRHEADILFDTIENAEAPVVIVTNETGYGIVPENALARSFRQAQGELNQRLAAEAELVVAVMAGLPIVLKGTAPAGAV
jgi:adenosylcobinamide kinase/adenosylcobinamide-phosphate guanylyltransferase